MLRAVEWDSLLNLQIILITLTWLPLTVMLCVLYSDILLQKLTNGVLITEKHKFFVYIFLTVAYIPLQNDLPTTAIMYGYYFIWQPLVVTSHHTQYNKGAGRKR
jgi:predicted membrane protein